MMNLLDKIRSRRLKKKIVNKEKKKDKLFLVKPNLPNNKKRLYK